tara:strand:+ start:12657 stop:13259 length:603 start_codon:yes stop_codon:yes gene_type:complete
MILTNKPLSSFKSIWTATTEEILRSNSQQQLPGPWQLMLLGDGSPTKHLHLITGHEVSIELIAMNEESLIDKNAPEEINQLPKPLLKRQVWLKCGKSTLAWAESWWNLKKAEEHLQNKDQPIWKSLTQDRYELFREIDGLSLVTADWLESKFNQKGPFWSRYYRFFRQKKELTIIREVFNPELEKWLGPIHKNKLLINRN